MIILPYMRIARYQYAASTDDTEDGRAQRSQGSISMGMDKHQGIGMSSQKHMYPVDTICGRSDSYTGSALNTWVDRPANELAVLSK